MSSIVREQKRKHIDNLRHANSWFSYAIISCFFFNAQPFTLEFCPGKSSTFKNQKGLSSFSSARLEKLTIWGVNASARFINNS